MSNLGSATRKTIFLIAAGLFAICAMNLGLSLALASSAHSAELGSAPDAPRQLQPRFDTDSNSAPSRGRRVQSPQLMSTMTLVQCGHLKSLGVRQDCMVQASGGPSAQNGAATAMVVSAE